MTSATTRRQLLAAARQAPVQSERVAAWAAGSIRLLSLLCLAGLAAIAIMRG